MLEFLLDTLYWQRAPQRKRPSSKKMEVLCLGFSREGYDSLASALDGLLYSDIYRMSTVTTRHREDAAFWTGLLKRKLRNGKRPLQTSIDFDRVLAPYTAVMDDPANIMGQELIDCYPDAKVILVGKRDTNGWYQSVQTAEQEMFTWRFWLLSWFDVRLYFLWRMFTIIFKDFFDADVEEKGKVYARQHYVDLEDHLKSKKRGYLEWSEDDGWGPLCEYLGKPVPKALFPKSGDESDAYDIQKATSDITFAAQWKQGAFLALATGVIWYYRSFVWFIISFCVAWLWENGYVDPRGPDLDHHAFYGG